MPRCPNCSYILVLLEKRGKYKCSKCGKLFLKKEIDDKDFREWNKQQREQTKEDFNKQLKLRRKTLKPKKKIDPIEQQKKLKEYRLACYYKYREKILKQKKGYRRRTKEKQNNYRKNYRAKHNTLTQILSRIHYWRQMQKELTLSLFSLDDYKNL